MKKLFIATSILVASLAVFIPFASSSPDGLEKALSSVGIEEAEPFWKGLMNDYSVAVLGDSYISTLMAGVVGTISVLAAGLLLGRAISKRNSRSVQKVMVGEERSQKPEL